MTLYVVCALGGRCFWAEFNDCFLLWLRDYEVHRWIVLNPSFGSLTTEACALLCGTSFAAAARAIRSHARGRTWRRKSKWYAIILRAYWNTWETTRSFENDEWILDDSILQIGGLLDQEFWVLPPWKLTCPLKNSKEFSEDYCPCEMAPFFFFRFLEVYNTDTNHWSQIPATKASPAATPRGEGRSTRQCLRAGRCPNDGVQACWYQPGILVKLRPPRLTHL